jgi:hypothetical protein
MPPRVVLCRRQAGEGCHGHQEQDNWQIIVIETKAHRACGFERCEIAIHTNSIGGLARAHCTRREDVNHAERSRTG